MATVENPTGAGDGEAGARRDPDQIAEEIEQTRAELAGSIDAIADRVSPTNLVREYSTPLAAIAVFFLLMALLRWRRSR